TGGGDFSNASFGGGKIRPVFFDRALGGGVLRCLLLQSRLIIRNIGAPGSDQLGKFCLTRRHWLALSSQTFVSLSFRGHRKLKLVAFLGKLGVAPSFRLHERLHLSLAPAGVRQKFALLSGFIFQLA